MATDTTEAVDLGELAAAAAVAFGHKGKAAAPTTTTTAAANDGSGYQPEQIDYAYMEGYPASAFIQGSAQVPAATDSGETEYSATSAASVPGETAVAAGAAAEEYWGGDGTLGATHDQYYAGEAAAGYASSSADYWGAEYTASTSAEVAAPAHPAAAENGEGTDYYVGQAAPAAAADGTEAPPLAVETAGAEEYYALRGDGGYADPAREAYAPEEKRYDASAGQMYSRREFVDWYGGTAEWEAAATSSDPASPSRSYNM